MGPRSLGTVSLEPAVMFALSNRATRIGWRVDGGRKIAPAPPLIRSTKMASGSDRLGCQIILFFTPYYKHLFPASLAWTEMVICSRHTPVGLNFGGQSALSHGERHGKCMDG